MGERGGGDGGADVGQDLDVVVASLSVGFNSFCGPDASRRWEWAGGGLRTDGGPDEDGVFASFAMILVCFFGSDAAGGVGGSEYIGESKSGGEMRRRSRRSESGSGWRSDDDEGGQEPGEE